MDGLVNPARCCQECGSRQYVFRGRKTHPAGDGQPATVETRYRCKPCSHEWRERVPVQDRR